MRAVLKIFADTCRVAAVLGCLAGMFWLATGGVPEPRKSKNPNNECGNKQCDCGCREQFRCRCASEKSDK